VVAIVERLWRNEYFETIIMLIIVIALVFGLWFGSEVLLGTQYPALAVASGSMCMVQHMACDGWSHPFNRTLHVGDLIIIQAVDPKTIKVGLDPIGDIIVFRRGDELIVHRAIQNETIGNDTCYITKGDANSIRDPNPVPEEDVVGRLVLRIPWIGHLALFMQDSLAIYLIWAIVVLLIIVELAVSVLRAKKQETGIGENVGNGSGA
jgi:signal peptidase I